MTVKPNQLGTVIVVSIGLVVGLLSTVRMRRVAPPYDLSSSMQGHPAAEFGDEI